MDDKPEIISFEFLNKEEHDYHNSKLKIYVIYIVEGTCDFDIPSFCNWTSDSTSDFEWILGTGQSTDFPVSGPPSDHTIGSKG